MIRIFTIGGSAILGLRTFHAESYKPETYKPETINRPFEPNVNVDEPIGNEPDDSPTYDDDHPGPRMNTAIVLRIVGGILIGVGHTLIAMADHLDKKD
jgi:hypothetical protein